MNRPTRPSPQRRRLLLLGGLLVLLGSAWLVHGAVLSQVVRWVVPWAAGQAGFAVTLGEVQARLSAPILLTDIEISRPGGTRLLAAAGQLDWARWEEWGWAPTTWIGRLAVRGLAGRVAPAEERPLGSAPPGPPVAPAAVPPWPRVVEIIDGNLLFTGSGWSCDLRGLDLLLTADAIGSLRVREAVGRAGQLGKKFADLRAVTAWRDGVAYFADLSLDENVLIDKLSVALTGPAAVTLQARAGGGYVYADISGGGASTKAALNALNVSLAGAAAFGGIEGDMEGTVDLAKLTFNGDPAQPLSAQISLRLEAKDFAWRKNAVEELTAGLSVAGRRIRLSECLLRQKANIVKLRGTLTLPPDSADWREAPFDFEVDADVGHLHSLAGLFGAPWNELSGGLRVEGQGSGRASDGEGWLKVRGWGLQARGIPASSLQADLKLEGRDLKLSGLDAQSGPDFARGRGQLTLDQSLNYQGRLELRVREVSRYLEPLGRFAPDWARQGGVLLFWDGDGTTTMHSGVVTLELVRFTGDLNPVPVNAKLSATYSPGNLYVSRFLLDRGPLSLSSKLYFGETGLTVQDLQLFSGRSRLLLGELFLPLSLDAVLARRPWQETVMTDRDVYAYIRSDDLDFGSLAALFGQETTLRGRADLRLDASGVWKNALIDGQLSVNGLAGRFPAVRLPSSRGQVTLQVRDRRASVALHLQPDGAAPLDAQAVLPLFGEGPDGRWSLLNQTEPWHIEIDLARVDLAAFAPTAGGLTADRGFLSGKIRIDQTPAAPQAGGTLAWEGGRVVLPGGWNPLEDIHARAVFSGTTAVFEETRARWGEGTLGVAANADFADHRNPVWEILLRGEALQIYRDENLRLQLDADLAARGDRDQGVIRGTLALEGSALLRGFSLAPQLGPVKASNSAPPFRIAVAPFAGWPLEVDVSAASPLPVGSDGTRGALRPDLYLRGTGAEPLLLGTIAVDNLRVALPADGELAGSGRLHFTGAKPWIPYLDLTGRARAGVYDIYAGAFGALDGRKLFFSSSPHLETGQIVMLLATGVSPLATPVGSVTPADKLAAEPSWLELDKVRGLLGWSTEAGGGTAGGDLPDWSLGEQLVGYEWGFR
ncbi:MAG: translocation/assembly module TamB domain-containing protein [Chthoniobacterales bacterium]